jgi:hypothetical protein
MVDGMEREYRGIVLEMLAGHTKELIEIKEKVNELHIKLAILETKQGFRSGMWGALGGLMSGIGAALLILLA